jgi:hypothetical protein
MSEIDWLALHKGATTVLVGKFPIVITAATATTSSTGKPMIKTTLKVESGPFAGRTIPHNFNISADSDTAMRIFFGQMAVLGLNTAFWQSSPSMDQLAATLIGRRAIVDVGTRTWQGTDREQVNNWEPAVGGPGGGQSSAPLGGFNAAPLSTNGPAVPTQPTVAQPSTPPPADPFAPIG